MLTISSSTNNATSKKTSGYFATCGILGLGPGSAYFEDRSMVFGSSNSDLSIHVTPTILHTYFCALGVSDTSKLSFDFKITLF